MRTVMVFFVLGLALGGTTTFAQSLGDVAKKEKERRKTLEKPGDVIDDEALSDAGRRGPRTESSVTVRSSASVERARTAAASEKSSESSTKQAPPPIEELGGGVAMCQAELQALKNKKVAANNALSLGVVTKSRRTRVNRPARDVLTGTNRDGSTYRTSSGSNRDRGHYQTVTERVTCLDAETDPVRHKKILATCKRLKQQVAALTGQITEKTAACEDIRLNYLESLKDDRSHRIQ